MTGRADESKGRKRELPGDLRRRVRPPADKGRPVAGRMATTGSAYDTRMPELPELEALVEAIAPGVCAAPISGPPRAHFAVLKTHTPALASLAGQRFVRVWRRAKYLVFDAESDTSLVVHLMTLGRIGYYPPQQSRRPRGGVLSVRLDDDGLLCATEGGTRKAMRVGMYTRDGLQGLFAPLGPEPLDDAFTPAVLAGVLRRDSRQLNAFLRDGRRIAGIGRAFADEILHEARLSPFALTTRLDDDAAGRLYDAIRSVLRVGVEECRRTQGLVLPARNDARLLRVHGHDGEPCPRCGATLRFVDFESNRIVYCSACQTGGRVLADRRMSRLLK